MKFLLAVLVGAAATLPLSSFAAAPVATSTIATFADGLVDQGFDMLFFLLGYIFPIAITIIVIAVIWGLVMGIVSLRRRR